MKDQIPKFLFTPEIRSSSFDRKPQSFSFIDRTLTNISGFIRNGYLRMEATSTNHLLQRFDPRIKVIFLFWFIIQISFIREIQAQLYISLYLFLLYILSRLTIISIYKRAFAVSFFFGFLVIAPAALNLVTEGKIILSLLHFEHAKQLWIYHIPSEIAITKEGMMIVVKLYLKILNSITLTYLVLYTTAFHELIRALKFFRIPDMLLLIVTMTYKFIFVMAHTVQETYFALKLRWWRKVKNAEADKIIAGRIVHIFRKSWHRYEETFRAMVARGFRGQVNFCYLGKIKKTDIFFLAISFVVSFIIYLS